MEKEKDYSDIYFEGLKNLEVTPPEDVWQRLDESLQKKKRAGMIYFWIGLAAGIAILISVGSYFLNNPVADHVATVQSPVKETVDQKSIADNRGKTYHTSGINNKPNPGAVSAEPETKINRPVITVPEILMNASIAEGKPTENKPTAEGTDIAYLAPLPVYPIQIKKGGLILKEEKEATPVIKPLQEDIITEQFIIANNIIPESAKQNKWAVSGQVAPLFSYRASAETNKFKENGLMAYTGGIKAEYKTNRKLSIQGGVYFAIMGQVLSDVTAYTNENPNALYAANRSANSITSSESNSFGPVTNNSNTIYIVNTRESGLPMAASEMDRSQIGNYYQNEPGKAEANNYIVENGEMQQGMRFLDFPLLLKYKVNESQIGFHLLGGITTHVLIDSKSSFLPDEGKKRVVGEVQQLSPVNYSATFGFGLAFRLSKHTDISVEPTYKYYINSFSTKKDVHPYAFGIFTGLSYKF